MRHLIHTLYLLPSISNHLLAVLAQSSDLHSPPSASYLQNIKLSHGPEDIWNSSGHFDSYYTSSESEHVEITLSSTRFLSYKRVVRHVVHLKPRGSRTAFPLGSNGEHLSAATRTIGVLPIEISLWATFRIGYRFLILTVVYLLWVFSSASGICYALSGSFAKALWALVFVGRLFVRSLISVIRCFWDMIIWVDKSVDHVFPWLMQTSSFLISPFTQFQERMNAREREWRNLNCIQRKVSNPRPNFNRPCGQRSATPLFRDQAHEFVHHLYLPEERNDLVRHMHDPRHFNHLKKIGAGAFGSIYLVEHRITGKTMAMKTLLRRENSSEEIGLEIRALIRLQGKAWYPKLLSTFMDPMNFYILMPFYAHGDLYSVMNSCGGCLSRELAKFYLAELIVAVQSLHKAGILHRDIKPDNILFDDKGHLIVADFGVAHVFSTDDEDDTFMADEYPLWVETKTLDNDGYPLLTPSIDNPHTIKGVAGTPFYAAPEILAGQEYSYGVDYYSLAIVYHEMVTGYVPIQCGPCKEGESEPTICLDLGRKDVHLQPISVSDYDLLCQMLDEDFYMRPTVKQMKNHLALAGIDWDRLSRRENPVPRVPGLRKRVPISPGFERCLTESSQGSP